MGPSYRPGGAFVDEKGTLRESLKLAPLDGDDLRATCMELFIGVQGWPGPGRGDKEPQGRLREPRELVSCDDDDKEATVMTSMRQVELGQQGRHCSH
jgi:hypothetical protein